MRFGLFGINIGVCASGQTAAQIAQAAEAAGFESVWTGEHVVLPDPQAPPSPVPPETPFLDPAVALALVAAHTQPPAARHRHHHPAAAQPARAGQGARQRRRGVRRAADLRPRHRLSEAGVRRARRLVRAQGRARGRVSRGDPDPVDGAAAGLPGTLRLLRRHPGAAAAGADSRIRRSSSAGRRRRPIAAP